MPTLPFPLRLLGCFLLVASLSCGRHSNGNQSPGAGSGEPAGFQNGISLPEATDTNPDPHIVEVNLEAKMASLEIRPGTWSNVFTYNGVLPGPLIRANAGDRVIVHFKNSLPSPTTIHWHGVRVPVAMDGTAMTQDPVPPGGTFDYDFHVPDGALFWYHSHIDSVDQVSGGLYGPLVVEDPSEPPSLGDEVIMVLSDINLDVDGGLIPSPTDAISELFGTEGNVILVNGRSQPRLVARAGLRQRWRLVNAAKTRFFDLALDGHTFVRIGGDGGLIEAPTELPEIVLAPGERADVLVTPQSAPGSDIALRWKAFDRGFGTAYGRDPVEILTVHVDEAAPLSSSSLPTSLRTILPLDTSTANVHEITFAYSTADAGPDSGVYEIDGTGPGQMVMANVGDTDVWHVTNQTAWDHPFHLHGFFFQPLDSSGAPIHEWKDTFDVPAQKDARFVVHYDGRPGNWMFHCHILEHADNGLMGMLMLQP